MKTLKISEETYRKIKDQLEEEEDKELDVNCYEDLIGKQFFFRTVTYHLVGRVVKLVGSFAQLEDASWVADSGRFMDAIKTGKLSEVEPVGIAFVNIDSTTDFFPWKHKLPDKQI